MTSWSQDIKKFFIFILPFWYAFLFGVALLLRLGFRLSYWLINYIWLKSSFFVLRRIVYPRIFLRVTRFGAVAGLLFLIANGLSVFKFSKGAGLSTRAATMSVINLVPLLCGHRLILMGELLGISLRSQFFLHKCFGWMAMAQALLHTVYSVLYTRPFEWNSVNLSGVVCGSTLGLLTVISLSFIRRLFYEWFLASHLILSISALIALWIHVSSRRVAGKVFLIIGVLLWTSMTAIHAVWFIFINWARGKSFAIAQVTQELGALKISIRVPRSWEVKGGQWVLLKIPAAGVTSVFQSHPFMIVWFDHTDKELTIYLLAKPRRGFTRQLTTITNRKLLAFIDGPHGQHIDFGEFGTELLRGYNSREVRTQSILLVWEYDLEDFQEWVRLWMQELLDMDTGKILKIFPGTRINQKFETTANVPEILREQLKSRKGKTIMSVCSNTQMANQVRGFAHTNMDHNDVRFIELEFEPSRKTSPSTYDFKCKA